MKKLLKKALSILIISTLMFSAFPQDVEAAVNEEDVIESADGQASMCEALTVGNLIYFSGGAQYGSGSFDDNGTSVYNVKTGKLKKLSKVNMSDMFYYKGYLYGIAWNDWIDSTKARLARMNVKTGKLQILAKGVCEYQLCNGRFVYNLNGNLYSVKMNGKGKKKIASKCSDFTINNNKCYYIKDNKLFSVKINGKGKKKIANDVSEYYIVDNEIVYVGTDDMADMYLTDLQGENKVLLAKNVAYIWEIDDSGYIFYNVKIYGTSSYYKLYSLNTDDKIANYIGKGNFKSVINKKIYYTNKNGNYFKSNLKGTKQSKITKNKYSKVSSSTLNIGNKYFYESNNKVYSMNKNGKNKKCIYKMDTKNYNWLCIAAVLDNGYLIVQEQMGPSDTYAGTLKNRWVLITKTGKVVKTLYYVKMKDPFIP